MPNKNSVTIAGHLGRDPELRYVGSGSAVCSFSVAVKDRWKQDGQDKEKTVWIDVKAWKDTAELANEHFKKGSAIHVEGKLDVEEWDDKQTGQKRSKVVIVANSVSVPLYKKKEQASQPRSTTQATSENKPEQDDFVPF